MSERGTFIVDRGIFGHPVFADEPFTEREAWLWLISQAAFKAHERRVGRVRVKLERGQLAHATRFMAEAWKWSASSVRRFLSTLVDEQMIAISDGADLTRITLCNYEAYQSAIEKAGAEVAQTRRKEEETEVSKKEGEGDTRARATPTISAEAHALSDRFLEAIRVDPRNPELSGMAGAPYAAAMWISRGYDHLLILSEAADLASRYGPDKPLKFYTACFETAHRKARTKQREMPLLQAVNGGAHEANLADRRGGAVAPDWQSSRDRFRAARAQLKAHIAELDAGEADGGQAARPAAAARRE